MFNDNYASGDEIAPQPIELRPIVAEALPFPVDALSQSLRDAVLAIIDIVQVPAAIAAQAVLGACSLVAQTRVNIKLPTQEVMPTSLFLFTVAASGDRKTSCDRLALSPIYEREKMLRGHYEQDQLSYTIEHAAHAAAVSKAKTGSGGSRDQIRVRLQEAGPPPVPPALPILLVDEATIEGAVKNLDEAYPALGLFSDEGAKMLGGYSLQEERRAATGGALSQLWDGKVVKRVRGTDVTKFLAGRRLSVHLMVQPGVAHTLFSDKGLRDQGMLSRLLVAHPRSIKGSRFWKKPTEESWAALRQYHGRLGRRMAIAFEAMDPVSRELKFETVHFSDAAEKLFISFSDHIEKLQAPDGDLEEISDLASKLAQHAARIATVIAYFENGPKLVERGLSPEAMSAGIRIAQFYAGEALRLYNAGSIDEDSENAADLIEFIRKKELKIVGLRWLSRNAPKRVRSGRVLKRAVEVLVEMGHLIAIKNGAEMEIGGKKEFQRDAYTVILDTGK